MSAKLYKDITTLRKACENYIKSTHFISPRSFRTYLGISKQVIDNWRKQQPSYFDVIKTYEDRILAYIEEVAIYGPLHPSFRNITTKISYKDGFVTGTEIKFNQVGAIFVLRAYDREQYVPELNNEVQEQHEPVQIVLDIPEPKKGAKRAYKPKQLISK